MRKVQSWMIWVTTSKEFTSLHGIFAFRVVGNNKVPRTVELLVEDDGYFYHKTKFHVAWLDSLIKAATEAKQLIENDTSKNLVK